MQRTLPSSALVEYLLESCEPGAFQVVDNVSDDNASDDNPENGNASGEDEPVKDGQAYRALDDDDRLSVTATTWEIAHQSELQKLDPVRCCPPQADHNELHLMVWAAVLPLAAFASGC